MLTSNSQDRRFYIAKFTFLVVAMKARSLWEWLKYLSLASAILNCTTIILYVSAILFVLLFGGNELILLGPVVLGILFVGEFFIAFRLKKKKWYVTFFLYFYLLSNFAIILTTGTSVFGTPFIIIPILGLLLGLAKTFLILQPTIQSKLDKFKLMSIIYSILILVIILLYISSTIFHKVDCDYHAKKMEEVCSINCHSSEYNFSTNNNNQYKSNSIHYIGSYSCTCSNGAGGGGKINADYYWYWLGESCPMYESNNIKS